MYNICQLYRHRPYCHENTSSHIFASCKRKMICATTIFILISHTALVAQWIARWIPNPKVRGSNPRWGNTILSF